MPRKRQNIELRGPLENVGGSKSNDWNSILTEQVFHAQWITHSDAATKAGPGRR
jgi:hypothetical protein